MNCRDYINEHKEELVRSLSELIQIPSVEGESKEGAPYGEGPARCLKEALNLCEEMGFRTYNMDNRVGWCEYGEGEDMVAVLGHLDVVPAGDGWKESEPFSGEVKDSRIYGRGAMDDKGPIVAALYALKALKETGFVPSKRVRLIFGTNEETGCSDMKWYRENGGEIPVMGFTPDGEFPLINGEKGIINFSCSCGFEQEGAYKLVKFEGGSASNVVPDYAYAELECPSEAAGMIDADEVAVTPIKGGIRVEAYGVSAHGSTPEEGENAIGRLARALANLPLEGKLAYAIAFIAERIGMETRGESIGLAMRDELSGELTVNLGVIKGDRGGIKLTFSVRYPVTRSYDDVYQRLSRAMKVGGFAISDMSHMPSLYMPPESVLVKTLCRVYGEHTNEKADPKCIGGGTYAKEIPNILAFGPIFPGDEVREHKADEYMEISRLVKNAELYASAIYELSK